MADLGAYLDKRDFGATPEPQADGTPSALGLRYSVMAYPAHHAHFRGHYSQRMTPIVGEPGGKISQAALTGYIRTRRQVGRVIKHAKRLYRRARGLPVILTQ